MSLATQLMPPPVGPLAPPMPMDPLLGGSLGIGPTGLQGLQPLPQFGRLPYANPAIQPGAFNLARQVPVGVGRQAAQSAMNLGPSAASSAAQGLGTRLTGQLSSFRGALKPWNLKAGLGWGLAGTAASGMLNSLDLGGEDSALDQTLTYGAMGAGIGAPFGPLGALAGTAAGSGFGLLKSIFGGGGGDDEEEDPVQVLATAIQQSGLTPEATEAVLTTYETQMALADGLPEDQREAAEAQAYNQASQMILQFMQEQQQAQQQAPIDAARTLAMQQQAQMIFEPLAQDITSGANLYAQAMGGIRDNLPESYRSVADATVARELTSADRLANAYRAQAALTPIAQQLTRYQQDQDAYAQQLFSQMLAQQAAGMTGGGGQTDVLSQLVPTG